MLTGEKIVDSQGLCEIFAPAVQITNLPLCDYYRCWTQQKQSLISERAFDRSTATSTAHFKPVSAGSTQLFLNKNLWTLTFKSCVDSAAPEHAALASRRAPRAPATLHNLK